MKKFIMMVMAFTVMASAELNIPEDLKLCDKALDDAYAFDKATKDNVYVLVKDPKDNVYVLRTLAEHKRRINEYCGPVMSVEKK